MHNNDIISKDSNSFERISDFKCFFMAFGLIKKGIRTNCINPGAYNTNIAVNSGEIIVKKVWN